MSADRLDAVVDGAKSRDGQVFDLVRVAFGRDMPSDPPGVSSVRTWSGRRDPIEDAIGLGCGPRPCSATGAANHRRDDRVMLTPWSTRGGGGIDVTMRFQTDR